LPDFFVGQWLIIPIKMKVFSSIFSNLLKYNSSLAIKQNLISQDFLNDSSKVISSIMVEKDRNLNDFQMNTFESDKEMPELNDFLSSFKGKDNDPIYEKHIKEEYLDELDSDVSSQKNKSIHNNIGENFKKPEKKNKEKVFKIELF